MVYPSLTHLSLVEKVPHLGQLSARPWAFHGPSTPVLVCSWSATREKAPKVRTAPVVRRPKAATPFQVLWRRAAPKVPGMTALPLKELAARKFALVVWDPVMASATPTRLMGILMVSVPVTGNS